MNDKNKECSNEALLDHFENVCITMAKQENEKGRVTAKVKKDYNESREKILAIMDRRNT